MKQYGSILFVLILFDPVVCIICSTIVLSALFTFTLLILAFLMIDYCFCHIYITKTIIRLMILLIIRLMILLSREHI